MESHLTSIHSVPNMYVFVMLLFTYMCFLSQTLKLTYIIRVHSWEDLDSERDLL